MGALDGCRHGPEGHEPRPLLPARAIAPPAHRRVLMPDRPSRPRNGPRAAMRPTRATLVAVLMALTIIAPVAAADPSPRRDDDRRAATSYDATTNRARVIRRDDHASLGPRRHGPTRWRSAARPSRSGSSSAASVSVTVTNDCSITTQSVTAQVTDDPGPNRGHGGDTGPIAVSAAAELSARARQDPGRPDADRDVVRRSTAGGRFAGARRGASDLPHARERGRQPRVRPRHVPRREPFGHARATPSSPRTGATSSSTSWEIDIRRDAVRAGQRLHVRQVPDVARQRPRLRRPAPALRPQRLHDGQLGVGALARHDRGQRPPPALPQQHHRRDADPARRRRPGHDGPVRAGGERSRGRR